MTGFKASLGWYWGEPFSDPFTKHRRKQFLVRHHVVLGGLPSEIYDHISPYFGNDVATYKTDERRYGPVSLVIVLKNKCRKQVSATWQSH